MRQWSFLFVFSPTAPAALAFEDTDCHAISGVHDLADQLRLSTTPTPEFVAVSRFRKSAAEKIHDALPSKRGTT
jgi:hypothetical protein